MVNSKNESGISQRFMHELLYYCSTHCFIAKVILFGSRARGDFHARSDIDLAISTDNATHLQQNLIEFDIQEMTTHLKIDVIFIDRIKKQELLDNINRDGVMLFEKGKALRKV